MALSIERKMVRKTDEFLRNEIALMMIRGFLLHFGMKMELRIDVLQLDKMKDSLMGRT